MVRTVNTETFISNALKVHSGFYDYSKVNYENSKTKVIIICPIHGEFQQLPPSHLKGCGCKYCKTEKSRLKLDEFKQRANKIHNFMYDYSFVNFKSIKNNITIICPIHGEFEQKVKTHLLGSNCPQCAINNKKSNTKEFINKALKIHGNLYNYDKVNYVDNHTKVIITCKIHGDFETTPQNHLNKKICKLCSIDNLKLKIENFIERANKIHYSKYDYSKVDYINNKTKVKIICPKHGEFLQRPKDHLKGDGCPKCILKSQVFLFEKLKSIFYNEKLLWEHSPSWLDNQRFDIYFPKYNIAVEYNGKQHYEVINWFGGEKGHENCLERDALKRKKCLDNKCNLFELKYDYKEIDLEVLEKEITTIIKMFKNES